MIAEDPTNQIGFSEPSLAYFGKDRLVAFMRAHGASDQLATAESFDRGQTWQPYQLHQVIGHPFHIVPITENSWFLVYGYRHPPYGIRARLIHDDLTTLSDSKEFIIRDDAFCADCGYPWACLLSNQVFVTYYMTHEDGIRHIAGSLLALD